MLIVVKIFLYRYQLKWSTYKLHLILQFVCRVCFFTVTQKTWCVWNTNTIFTQVLLQSLSKSNYWITPLHLHITPFTRIRSKCIFGFNRNQSDIFLKFLPIQFPLPFFLKQRFKRNCFGRQVWDILWDILCFDTIFFSIDFTF